MASAKGATPATSSVVRASSVMHGVQHVVQHAVAPARRSAKRAVARAKREARNGSKVRKARNGSKVRRAGRVVCLLSVVCHSTAQHSTHGAVGLYVFPAPVMWSGGFSTVAGTPHIELSPSHSSRHPVLLFVWSVMPKSPLPTTGPAGSRPLGNPQM